uniref:Glycosyltransferase 25 family member n=1 Tax=Ditylenchus dipsaci TaxID=166011 RepID=A0A915CSU5_9BILA
MHVSFFVEGEQDEDVQTPFSSAINKWVTELSQLYLSTALKQVDRNWREEALVNARRKSCAYAFLMDSDNLLMQNSLKQLIDLDKNNVVVSPLLNAPFGSHSNVHGLLGEEFSLRKQVESVRVYYSRGPLLIYMKHKDASYLSFDDSNVLNYQGNGHPISVFAFSAFAMNISILMDNHNFYGYLVDSGLHSPAEHRTILNSFLANLVSDSGPMPFPHSNVLEPQRRPERLRKMSEILRLIGIKFEFLEAVDGKQLTEADLSKLTMLPDYEDPFYKRPMKSGEIGCFLSHYKIWEQVVQNKWDRVIVLEDDVRFTENATKVLKGW